MSHIKDNEKLLEKRKRLYKKLEKLNTLGSDSSSKESETTNESSCQRKRCRSPIKNGAEVSEPKLLKLPKSEKVSLNKVDLYNPALEGCRSIDQYEFLNRVEEGTYGVVYRGREKTTKQIVALKRLKLENEKNCFPIATLREITALWKARHINIVDIHEIVTGQTINQIYIVMDYVEYDLKTYMDKMVERKQTFTSGEIKFLMQQLLRAVEHLHDNYILHRDLKTSNLLLTRKGILKVADFGLAREYGSPLRCYTPVVVTLWYRAPELLLGVRKYSTPIDIWSVGCIFAELLLMKPFLKGKNELDQLKFIFKVN